MRRGVTGVVGVDSEAAIMPAADAEGAWPLSARRNAAVESRSSFVSVFNGEARPLDFDGDSTRRLFVGVSGYAALSSSSSPARGVANTARLSVESREGVAVCPLVFIADFTGDLIGDLTGVLVGELVVAFDGDLLGDLELEG